MNRFRSLRLRAVFELEKVRLFLTVFVIQNFRGHITAPEFRVFFRARECDAVFDVNVERRRSSAFRERFEVEGDSAADRRRFQCVFVSVLERADLRGVVDDVFVRKRWGLGLGVACNESVACNKGGQDGINGFHVGAFVRAASSQIFGFLLLHGVRYRCDE